jgi:hypothetical protein
MGNKKARGERKITMRILARGFADIEATAMDRKYEGSERMAFHAEGAVKLYERVGFLAPNSVETMRQFVTFVR